MKEMSRVTLEEPREGMQLPCLVSSTGAVGSLDVLFGDDIKLLTRMKDSSRGGRSWERAALFEGRYYWVEVFYADSYDNDKGSFGLKIIGRLHESLADNALTCAGFKAWTPDVSKWWDERNSLYRNSEMLLGQSDEPTFGVAIELGNGDSCSPIILGVPEVEDFYAPPQICGLRVLDLFDKEGPDGPDRIVGELLGKQFIIVREEYDHEEEMEPFDIRIQGDLNRSLLEKFAPHERTTALFKSADGRTWCGRVVGDRRTRMPHIYFD